MTAAPKIEPTGYHTAPASPQPDNRPQGGPGRLTSAEFRRALQRTRARMTPQEIAGADEDYRQTLADLRRSG